MSPRRPPASNWSGSHRYRATELHRPTTLDELRRVVAAARRLRVLGTRHTFSAIGDSEALVALDGMPDAAEIAVDAAAMSVSVGPAVTYARLAEGLAARGLALANLGSLAHISVLGAVATATHGSGDGLGNLATSVLGLRLLTSTGDLLEIERGDPRFHGAVVHLGALGVVIRLTLAVQPHYELRQVVYEGLDWELVPAELDAIASAGRSVSVFHRFDEGPAQVWVKDDPALPAPDQLLGARPADGARNPVPGADPTSCTVQLGVPGPWSERLPHFRSGFAPSSGEEIQSELFVARGDAAAALRSLRPLSARIRPLLHVAELRTIAADGLWLSPQHDRDSVGLHFTWRRRPAEVAAVLADVEAALAPLEPRPHWGKLFCARAAALAPRYPRLEAFRRLRAQLDPRGAFVNDWLRERVLGDG